MNKILFLDTTVEFPELYAHLKQVEDYLNRKITIIKLEHDFEYMMFDYVKKKGKNKGKKGYGWSGIRTRWCTRYCYK